MNKEELKDVLKEFKSELKEELKQEFSTPQSVVIDVDQASGEDKTAIVTLDQYNTLKKELDDLKADYEKFKAEDISITRPEASGGNGSDVWNWGKE